MVGIDRESGRRIPMSRTEFEALGEGVRGEHIDGELVVSPSPTQRHQQMIQALIHRVAAVLLAGVEVISGWGWRVGPDEFIPDVMVYDATDDQLCGRGALQRPQHRHDPQVRHGRARTLVADRPGRSRRGCLPARR